MDSVEKRWQNINPTRAYSMNRDELMSSTQRGVGLSVVTPAVCSYLHGLSIFTVNRLYHGIDITKAVSVRLIGALRIVRGMGNMIGINAVAVTHIL